MLTILHISDIHLSRPKFSDFEFVKNALFRDLAEQKTVRKPDIICFSGDLVHAGGIDDDFYMVNEHLIEPLLKATELSQNNFFLVPGNHDIDRDEVRNNSVVEDGQFNSLSSREKVNAFVDQILIGADTEFNFRRLNNFFEFRDLISSAPCKRASPFFTTHVLNVADLSIGVACLNTAWRSTGEEGKDYGRLLLGERSLTEAARDIANCDVRVAMLHHPLSWLREFDREDCRPILMREFDLILTGHTHRQSPEWQETPMGRAVISQGGALYVSRRWFNGYCFIEFDKQRARCDFTVRRYEDDPKSFEPATNVAPNGRFLVHLRGPEDIQRYVSVENILLLLRPFWEEKALEHILASYAGQPSNRRIEDLYIPVEFSAKSQLAQIGYDISGSKSFEDKPIREIDIVNMKKPVLIYGQHESGKTTLAYYLGHLSASGRAKELKIPVYIDLAFLKPGTGYVEKAVRAFLRSAGVQLDVEEYLNKGAFFVVIDNFETSHRDVGIRARKLDMLESFLLQYPQNNFVLLADKQDETVLKINPRPTYKFGHEVYYVQPLTRKNIRDLTHARLKERGQGTRRNVEAILRQIENAGLPKTAHVVLMLIAVMENDKAFGQINEATLLERFIEAMLNKSSASEFDRASIDYTLKDAYLAHLAHHIVSQQGETYVDKNELAIFTVEFFHARSWPYDAVSFLNRLIQAGILYEGETDEGTKVAFRYRCLREFYLARYFQLDRTFLDRIIIDDRTLDYVREIDLFTGLTRNETPLMKILLDRTRAQAQNLDVGVILASYEPRLRYNKSKEVSDTFVTGIKESLVSDEELDKVMDLAERLPERPIPLSELAGRIPKALEGLEDRSLGIYFGSILVLSAVVRNSELIDSPGLKLAAVHEALNGWAFFASRQAKKFDELSAGEGSPEELEEFTKLTEARMKSVELLVKCAFAVMLSMTMGEYIETDKLRGIFQKCYSETDEAQVYKRMLLFCILIDLAFVHGDEPQGEALRLVEDLVRRHRDNIAVLAIVFAKLNALYYRPNLGDENRKSIEGLMTEIYLKCYGVEPKYRGVVGSLRDQFLKSIKAMRERKERRDEALPDGQLTNE